MPSLCGQIQPVQVGQPPRHGTATAKDVETVVDADHAVKGAGFNAAVISGMNLSPSFRFDIEGPQIVQGGFFQSHTRPAAHDVQGLGRSMIGLGMGHTWGWCIRRINNNGLPSLLD